MSKFDDESSVYGVSEQLRERSDLLTELRQFFDRRDFIEVQTPCLAAGSIVDPFIDPIELNATALGLPTNLSNPYYLQSSPELWMKRLLSQGSPSIYGISPAFRAGESGSLHQLEFTMLEWYELGASEQDGINLLSQLARHVMRCEEVDVWDYRQVFQTYLGVDPIDDSKEALVEIASQCDQELAKSLATDRDGLLDVLLSELIQPQLGVERPLIVRNYPLTQAALAKVAPDDPNCASRFELFVGGIELANGYDELRDEKVLVERINKSQMKRLKAGLKLVRPPAEAVLAEISHQLPQCAGVALGVDRLHLVRSGKQSLNQISPYHW